VFDNNNLLHIRDVPISLKEDGIDIQTAQSGPLGKGTFTTTTVWKPTSKYEIFTTDSRFILPLT
jgi:hypothetical protein